MISFDYNSTFYRFPLSFSSEKVWLPPPESDCTNYCFLLLLVSFEQCSQTIYIKFQRIQGYNSTSLTLTNSYELIRIGENHFSGEIHDKTDKSSLIRPKQIHNSFYFHFRVNFTRKAISV